MVRFDLSKIPVNATIQSAILTLTVYSDPDGGSFCIYKYTKAWKATEVTWKRATATANWQSPGGDLASTPELEFSVADNATRGSVVNLDLTNSVKQYVANPIVNNGWQLVNKNRSEVFGSPLGTNVSFYATKHDGKQAERPKLTITYSVGSTSVATAPVPLHQRKFIISGNTLRLTEPVKGIRFELVSYDGKNVWSFVSDGNRSFDLSSLPSGIYVMRSMSGKTSKSEPICIR